MMSIYGPFSQIFESELSKHKLRKDAFNSAKIAFEDKHGIEGYSSYESYLVVRNRKINDGRKKLNNV